MYNFLAENGAGRMDLKNELYVQMLTNFNKNNILQYRYVLRWKM